MPRVTVLVAAHNEEAVIAGRITNALESDYPAELLEVLVASDGSSDNTESIVSAFQDPRVRLLSHHPNMGKAWTVNRAIEQVRSEVVVMSDANTEFEASAVRTLVERLFAPDSPVTVVGELRIRKPAGSSNEDGLYWRYENWIKGLEGDRQAVLGANGGIYAFRSSAYQKIPDNTILDDLSIPLLIKIEEGGIIVFERGAIAYEESPHNISDEFQRRVRISAGAFQSLSFLWPILLPASGLTAFAFFSHKLLRWITPHLTIVAGICAVCDTDAWYSVPFLFGLATALVCAFLGFCVKGSSGLARFVRLVALFVSMNVAILVGFVRWLVGNPSGAWERTPRN